MAYHSAFNRDDDGRPRERAGAGRKRPLLPPVIANTLLDAVLTAAGAVCLVSVAIAGLSLASWSPSDPSLTHATSAAPHNVLGRPGSTLADLLIEMLGLASLALLMAPLFWGLAFLRREGITRPIRRVLAAVAGTGGASVAIASVPPPPLWPAHHGLGGFAGESLARLALSLCPGISPAIASPGIGGVAGVLAALLLGFAAGLLWDGSKMGAERTTLGRRARSSAKPSTRKTRPDGDAAGPRIEPELEPASPKSRYAATGPAPTRQAPSARDQAQFGPYAFAEHDELEPHSDFDVMTHAASSAIAARFAPPGNAPHALQDQVSHAFNAPFGEGETAPEFAVDEFDEPRTAGRTRATTRSVGGEQTYKRPSLNLLERPRLGRTTTGFTGSVLRGTARLLEDVMAEFGVIGAVRAITPGPVVTTFEFEPDRGTRVDRVVALADDIARGMHVASARIAPIPGRPAVVVELPNGATESIALREVLDTEAYRSSMDILPLAIGKTSSGVPVVSDLTRMPNLLVAGDGGSGRSAGIQAMILSLIYKHGPDNCRFLMIGHRMVELSRFEGIPHLLTPVVTDPHKAVTALAWCVREMEERMKRMAALGARSIDVYNNRVRNAQKRGERIARTVQTGFDERTGVARFEKTEMKFEPMPYIVIVIEELADLMAVAGREIEGAVQRLAVAARQAGIHLIVASERPSSDVVTPALKAGIAARISYRVKARTESRTVLGTEGAEQLLGGGDMLFTLGPGEPARVHGVTVSETEVDQVTDHLRKHGQPQYVQALMAMEPMPAASRNEAAISPGGSVQPATRRVTAESQDALFDRAVAIVVRERRASVSLLERRLNLSRPWALALLERLEDAGIVGPSDGNGHRHLRADTAA